MRRRFKGQPAMPKIGYGSNKRTRHLMPNGLKKVVVRNVGDVDLLLMHNGKYAAEVAHNVSSKKRVDILARWVSITTITSIRLIQAIIAPRLLTLK